MKTILMFPGVALAATLGFAQPTLAASSQQSDENIGHQAQSDTNGPAEKMENSDQIRQQNWDRDGREQGAMGSRAGWMGHHNRRFGAEDGRRAFPFYTRQRCALTSNVLPMRM